MPLIPYQWTPTEDVGEASLTKFGMSADGDLELMAPSKRLELPYQYAEPKKDRPKLAVAILDRSPSMNWQLEAGKNNTNYVPWGDKSKWHYLLWGWFAMTNDMIESGSADCIDNDAILYATDSERHTIVTTSNLNLSVDGFSKTLRERKKPLILT